MPGFNLSDYQPVEDRIRAFWDDHPEGRITTKLVPSPEGHYIVRAKVWRTDHAKSPDATGYAHEVQTDRGVNATSALENCETSAIGRALANLGYAPKGARPSREEMSKSAPPSPSRRSREAGGDGSPPTGHPPASDLPQREGAGETTGKAAADVEASGSGEAPDASTTCPDCGESDFTIVGLTDGQLRAGFVACVNTTCGRKYRRAA